MTLQNHIANFLNHPSTRLIHPAKNEIGRTSEQIFQINSKLCETLKVNEWKNTANVIKWFEKNRKQEFTQIANVWRKGLLPLHK